MDSRADRVERFSKIFSKSRYDAGVSQERLAAELGVSRKTIQNWESGVSFPDFFQMTEWFRALDINATPYFIQYLNYDNIGEFKQEMSDSKIEEALDILIHSLSMQQKRALLYILYGSHNSSPNSVIQLSLAHLHTPLENRVTIAGTVIDNYEMCEKRGTLIDTNHILPDMDNLNKAYESAKKAVMEGKNYYEI